MEELRRHMLECSTNCQNVSEGKLYFCDQGWAADQCGLFKLKETDYLNLKDICNCADKKEKLRRFYFGELSESYFNF